MAKGGRKKKDKWAKLPDEFRNKINVATEADLRQAGSQVAFNQIALAQQLKNDPDVQRLSVALTHAKSNYVEGRKLNQLKLEYIRETLKSQGKDVGSFDPEEAKEERQRINEQLLSAS